jgi:two-component sensor histidine kinase
MRNLRGRQAPPRHAAFPICAVSNFRRRLLPLVALTDPKVSTTLSSNRLTFTPAASSIASASRLSAFPSNIRIWERTLSNGTVFQEFDLPAPRTDSVVLRETDEFLLLREMHHRVANTLTVLTSVLWQELALSGSPGLRDSLARCEARIVAFGNLHRSLLVGAPNDWISVQYYIERLCGALSEALLKPLGIRCEVSADAGELPGERCERLGLIIAELVTNVAKHAFHERNDGLVRVELINRMDSWVCVVSDNGVGTVKTPLGVGSAILKQLVRALGGNLVRKSGRDGTSVVITCQM